uniref:ZP domain-containing protein n=1 Tax=Denticeps clupeoides TaxID=299321 RepID=A0AAY4B4F8_9TELE
FSFAAEIDLKTIKVLWSNSQMQFQNRSKNNNSNSDVMVTCGTNRMELNILMCGVYFSGFNSSLLALNGQFGKPDCMGTPDWIARPPVLKFNFSITEQEVGSGLFSDYSNVQFVNVSGAVSSLDPSAGTITYRQQMLYMFSCRYPLQYLINNTRIGVAGVSLAVKDNNGSFISSLAMNLYGDSSYTSPLSIPDSGLNLKTRIYVEVKATNLTERFNVLLDRCYATPSPYPVNRSFFDLFVGCNHDAQTVMGVNGASQQARFSFEAFRFVEHRNQTVSTFYIHCATRLCERTYCSSLMQVPSFIGRRRRAVETAQGTSVTDVATVTSGPILTRLDKGRAFK